MDILFPRNDDELQDFKEAAVKMGFEELTVECTASLSMLQPHDRLSVLIMGWKRIGDYLTKNQYVSIVGNVVNWIGRHTLELWFGRDWISCPADNKTALIEFMMKVYPTAYISMCPYSWPYMFSIYRDPWMVDYLNANFQNMNDPDLSDRLEAKDSDFIQQEGLFLIFLRIVNMFDFNMMKLVKHMCRRLLLAWHDTTSSAHRSLRATVNAAESIEYVRHMYLMTVNETDGLQALHYVLESVQRNMHCNSVECGNLDKAAQIITLGLLECKKTLVEFLIAFVSKSHERHFSNTFGNVIDKYKSFLIEYLIRKIHTRRATSNISLLSPDGAYENLVKMFISKRESSEDLMKTTAAVSERLFARVRDLKALKFSYDQIKCLTRAEWYTTKVTLLLGIIIEELNTLEDFKYTEGQTAEELMQKEQDLAVYYRDLSKLLGRTPVLEQEAWLTTFSLHPCKEYLEAVTKCGSRNLRVIKKQAIKLKVIMETKPQKNAETNPEHRESLSSSIKEKTALAPESGEFPSSSTTPSEVSCGSKEDPLSSKTVAGASKRLPSKKTQGKTKAASAKANEDKGTAGGGATAASKKAAIADARDKDTAEVMFAASAGAGESVSVQTELTIKYPDFALINSVTDTEDVVKYTNYDGDVLAQYRELTRILSNIRLQHSNYDDLLALLIAPRYKRLTWATCWKSLRKRCRFLLTKDNKKKQIVEQYLADANERLTHLQIDYEKFKNKPQIDYGSIENGYECFDTESGDDTGLTTVVAGLKRAAKIRRQSKKCALQEGTPSDQAALESAQPVQQSTSQLAAHPSTVTSPPGHVIETQPNLGPRAQGVGEAMQPNVRGQHSSAARVNLYIQTPLASSTSVPRFQTPVAQMVPRHATSPHANLVASADVAASHKMHITSAGHVLPSIQNQTKGQAYPPVQAPSGTSAVQASTRAVPGALDSSRNRETPINQNKVLRDGAAFQGPLIVQTAATTHMSLSVQPACSVQISPVTLQNVQSRQNAATLQSPQAIHSPQATHSPQVLQSHQELHSAQPLHSPQARQSFQAPQGTQPGGQSLQAQPNVKTPQVRHSSQALQSPQAQQSPQVLQTPQALHSPQTLQSPQALQCAQQSPQAAHSPQLHLNAHVIKNTQLNPGVQMPPSEMQISSTLVTENIPNETFATRVPLKTYSRHRSASTKKEVQPILEIKPIVKSHEKCEVQIISIPPSNPHLDQAKNQITVSKRQLCGDDNVTGPSNTAHQKCEIEIISIKPSLDQTKYQSNELKLHTSAAKPTGADGNETNSSNTAMSQNESLTSKNNQSILKSALNSKEMSHQGLVENPGAMNRSTEDCLMQQPRQTQHTSIGYQSSRSHSVRHVPSPYITITPLPLSNSPAHDSQRSVAVSKPNSNRVKCVSNSSDPMRPSCNLSQSVNPAQFSQNREIQHRKQQVQVLSASMRPHPYKSQSAPSSSIQKPSTHGVDPLRDKAANVASFSIAPCAVQQDHKESPKTPELIQKDAENLYMPRNSSNSCSDEKVDVISHPPTKPANRNTSQPLSSQSDAIAPVDVSVPSPTDAQVRPTPHSKPQLKPKVDKVQADPPEQVPRRTPFVDLRTKQNNQSPSSVPQSYMYTYFAPELNTVQIVKPSGTTRINKMRVEIGQGIRRKIPKERRDLLRLTSANKFPNPRWRPIYSSIFKRKLIFVPTEAELKMILSEYKGQRQNGRTPTYLDIRGLTEDQTDEEILDESVIINLTNPRYVSEGLPSFSDTEPDEMLTCKTKQTNQSRPEVEGQEAGVKYKFHTRPPLHFFIGIPTPAYHLSLLCPHNSEVQKLSDDKEDDILTVEPNLTYKMFLFLKDDDFAWEKFSLTRFHAPQKDEDDDDEGEDDEEEKGDKHTAGRTERGKGAAVSAGNITPIPISSNQPEKKIVQIETPRNAREPSASGEVSKSLDIHPDQETHSEEEETSDAGQKSPLEPQEAAAPNSTVQEAKGKPNAEQKSPLESQKEAPPNPTVKGARGSGSAGSSEKESRTDLKPQVKAKSFPDETDQLAGSTGSAAPNGKSEEPDTDDTSTAQIKTMRIRKLVVRLERCPEHLMVKNLTRASREDSGSDSEISLRRSGRYALKVYGAASRSNRRSLHSTLKQQQAASTETELICGSLHHEDDSRGKRSE